MAGQQNINSIPNPELTDAFQQLKLDIFRTLNCVKVGQIQNYNASRNTAQVQILFQRVLNDGSIAPYPVLVDCPVFTLQGGGAAIQFPIATGDQCLLLFSDRNIDAWFQNGSAVAPFDARCHDLSDGIALVGLNSLSSGLPASQANITKIFYDGAQVSLSGGLVKIANLTTTLLTLINGFITLLEAAQVQGPGATIYPFTAAFITLLEAYKLQFAELLQ